MTNRASAACRRVYPSTSGRDTRPPDISRAGPHYVPGGDGSSGDPAGCLMIPWANSPPQVAIVSVERDLSADRTRDRDRVPLPCFSARWIHSRLIARVISRVGGESISSSSAASSGEVRSVDMSICGYIEFSYRLLRKMVVVDGSPVTIDDAHRDVIIRC